MGVECGGQSDGAEKASRKQNRKRIIVIISVFAVAMVILGAYIATPRERYWKPDREFTMPDVEWEGIQDACVVKRLHYNDINGTIINQTIGAEKNDGNFRFRFGVRIPSYLFDPTGEDILKTRFFISFEKIDRDYVVKEVVFRYQFGDENLTAMGIDDYYLATENLYLTGDRGNYGGYTYRINYEWEVLHQLRGINKNAEDIKNGGLSSSFTILMFDSYPDWTAHTITLTATLYYGHPTVLGWSDVRELSTSVVIYVIPEGGV